MAGAPSGTKRAPFATPAHLRDASGTFAVWFTEPPGAVIQVAQACLLTVNAARWLVRPGLAALVARFPAPTPLVLVLDLGLMTGRDAGVRPLIVEAAKELRPRLARAIVLPPHTATALYRASLSAGVAMLRAFGVTVEVARSLPVVVSSVALRSASAAARPAGTL